MSDNHTLNPHQHQAGILYGYVDSDWAGDKSHRRSISGAGIIFTGAIIILEGVYCKNIHYHETNTLPVMSV